VKAAVLLRAVNVGGRQLAMADFKAALAELGYPGAATLGAAGSAVVEAQAAPSEAELEQGLSKALGPLEVFVRSGAQLKAVLAANPFAEMAKADPAHLLVVFLKGQPSAAGVAALQGRIVGRETVAAGPGCLYAGYPDGVGRSKLTMAVVERALGLRGTARNWNTVGKLTELLGD
jgi:uncharacterized protein (DUF1697 family)